MFPFTGLRLLLPAIVPSWRFFDAVTASPRVDYALLTAPDRPAEQWYAFRPRTAVLTIGMMLRRLFWNPQWNEDLFLVSLAERLIGDSTPETDAHSQRELMQRVARHLDRHAVCRRDAYLQLRLRLVDRADPAEDLTSQIVYLSAPCRMAELVTT